MKQVQKLMVITNRKPVGFNVHRKLKKELKLVTLDISAEHFAERFAHISSHDLYMLMSDPEVWNQADMVYAFGVILGKRFEQTGDINTSSHAILAHQRAVQLTPNGHADMPSRLINLGNSLLNRSEHTDDLADIANAISAHQQAVRLTPDGHADIPGWLHNLGSSFSRRFQRTGDLTNIADAISAQQRAVQLTPSGHVDMPRYLNGLGNSFALRFEHTGDLIDISNAISAHQRAVQLTPDDHANKPVWLNNLGISFLDCFQRTGDPTDVANAISANQRALQLTPDGHLNMPVCLNSLGNSFLHRFECTGDLTDIANAISAHQRAIQLPPNDHATMHMRLSNLGNSFARRFRRTGDLTDIADAISAQQRAVQLIPDGHANMPTCLNNLGNSFLRRYERTGDLTNVANAISAHQRGVQLTPDGHASMASWLSSLGNCFSGRFQRTGNLTDVANAISAHHRAVQLTPDGHANKPLWLNNLGNCFSFRSIHTGDFSDIVAAISNHRKSATHKSGPPSVRLDAARCWAHLSLSHNPTGSLKAYGVCINLLSQIAGMDRTVQQRHSSLFDISILTATAASAAFSQGEVGKALEWLEQGRCLVWNQLNQLRTPVDDLRTHNHLLADRFLHVSRALESSGSRQESISLALNGTLSQKVTLQGEAHTHAMLAREWEQLLEEIRGIPAFYDFLRPRTASNIMKHLRPRDGPVILINVHEDRCDALALIPDCRQPLHIPLDNLTHQYASVLRDHLRSCLLSHGRRMRTADLDLDRATRPAPKPNAENGSDIQKVLQELWHTVVKPILDALSYPVSLKSIDYAVSFIRL